MKIMNGIAYAWPKEGDEGNLVSMFFWKEEEEEDDDDDCKL
jgi:hypothetical protein